MIDKKTVRKLMDRLEGLGCSPTINSKFDPVNSGAPYVVRPARPRSYLDFEKVEGGSGGTPPL